MSCATFIKHTNLYLLGIIRYTCSLRSLEHPMPSQKLAYHEMRNILISPIAQMTRNTSEKRYIKSLEYGISMTPSNMT